VKLLLWPAALYTERMVRQCLTACMVLLCSYTAFPCENSLRFSSAGQCGVQSNPLVDRELRNALRGSRAVEPMHVQKAFCKLPPPTAQSMKRWLKSREESELKNAFDALVPEDKREVPGCKTTACKAQKIFGKSIGLKLLYFQSRYKLNGSHLTNENASAWTDEELESIMLAVQDFPETIAQFEKPLVRYTRGRSTPHIEALQAEHPGSCVPSTDYLLFFDCFFTFGDKDANRASVFHELSHTIGERSKMEFSREWLEISKWGKDPKGKPIPEREDCFISANAMAKPEEDFADSMMAYRYDPAGLMSACPAKYTFLKDRVFQGTEYTSATSCTH
jgi:hypothetical protein